MNFIQLCQAVARESGTVANVSSFTTIAGASGRTQKVAAWVSDAWRDIQNERGDWLFMRRSFQKPLIIGQAVYAGSTFTLTDVGRWIGDNPDLRAMSLFDPAVGQKDEFELVQIPYEVWRQRYDRGAHDNNRPTQWAISPRNELCVGDKPDKAYTLRGEYRAKPQILAVDNDIPAMPDEYHGLIVGEALRLMADSDEAYNVLTVKSQRYDRLRSPLIRDQTPQVVIP